MFHRALKHKPSWNVTHVISHDYIQCIQCFRSSLCWWQARIDVHLKPKLRYLQRPDLHCFRHAQQVISRQLSGIGLSDIRLGFSSESTRCHPISTGARRLGMAQWAFHHTMVWQWTRIEWKWRASLVGDIASGLEFLENNIYRVASSESVLCTLYIRQTNASADLMVSCVSSPRLKSSAGNGVLWRLSMMIFWCDLQNSRWCHSQWMREMVPMLYTNFLVDVEIGIIIGI